MNDLFRFSAAVERDPRVDAWFEAGDAVRLSARRWFEMIRGAGPEVRELVHDGCPTACVRDAAFAYVDAFKAHVNIGFYQGSALPDPERLLEGGGQRMRHVKVHWGRPLDEAAVEALIASAYRDMQARL